MSSNPKKASHSQKEKTDKKGGHGTFLYIFGLTVTSNWAPKITLQRFTVIRQKILNWPFAAFKKGVFGEKKVNRWNKILGRELAGGILGLWRIRNILIFEWSPIFCQWRFNGRSPIAIHLTYTAWNMLFFTFFYCSVSNRDPHHISRHVRYNQQKGLSSEKPFSEILRKGGA